ncbi:MAG TPA: hypothetical protein EYP06_04795, partial [Desulfobacterales bacterium]|nr:hypothetical protein [Desulfobacterales bacterium]
MNGKQNLDFVAATAAHQICEVIGTKLNNKKEVGATDVENLVTKALSVLQAQGIYAMALLLLSRSGKKTNEKEMSAEERVAVQILACLWSLCNPQSVSIENGKITLNKEPCQINTVKKDMLNEFRDLTQDMDTLLLVREL